MSKIHCEFTPPGCKDIGTRKRAKYFFNFFPPSPSLSPLLSLFFAFLCFFFFSPWTKQIIKHEPKRHVPSQFIVSHFFQIISHPIPSYPVPFHRISFYPISLYPMITLYSISSHPLISRPIPWSHSIPFHCIPWSHPIQSYLKYQCPALDFSKACLHYKFWKRKYQVHLKETKKRL